MNSHVTNQLQITVPVTLLLFRPSESPFASLSSLFCVGSAISSSHLSPRLHWHSVMDQQLSD